MNDFSFLGSYKKFLGLCSVLFIALGASMHAKSYLPKHESITLKNGLQVVSVPLTNKSGVIEVDVLYKVGSRNEIMGKSGIAHMLEHLNFKSTKNLKAGEFDKIVKRFGGVSNASTSFDVTRYFIKTSQENLDKSLELFAETMGSLNLKEDEFLPERQVVAEERLWRTDNSPIGMLYFRFFNTAYIYHSYHWTPIGFMEDIQNWTLEDIKHFHSLYYQPKNAIVLVVGDIDSKKVFELTKKHFESLKNLDNKAIPTPHTKEPKQDGARMAVVHKDGVQLEWIALGYKVPNFKHKDQVALDAISILLSGGNSSWLQKELVDKKRLASQAFSNNMQLQDESVFLFIAGGNPNIKAETLKQEIVALLEKLKKGQITQEELDKLKINQKADFISNLENSSDVAGLFADYLVQNDIQGLTNYQQQFAELKISDLVRVANEYFKDSQSTTVFLKP
ncbi:M16 family metallopeptidase [Helicobacter cetorum]|uniref:Zinc protease n=1 Tax=Helicobacter cetorum (strain ATCC BAA-429 / MIT 00-7128) TaxID=182217 RepID=I0EM51_HELC0|nr:pitrilysin family protein [Helicobacter cetorum]AFI04020.1 zinc protease [Helicobacter cetorum MIT 00-7128]